MNRVIRWTCRSAYALFVAFALIFGGTQAFATTAVTECEPNPDGIVRTCPPYNDAQCDAACKTDLYTRGACLDGCCVCWL